MARHRSQCTRYSDISASRTESVLQRQQQSLCFSVAKQWSINAKASDTTIMGAERVLLPLGSIRRNVFIRAHRIAKENNDSTMTKYLEVA